VGFDSQGEEQKLRKKIRRIVFTHDADTVTCTLGEQIVMETPRQSRKKPYQPLPPLRQVDPGRVVAIEDAGNIYLVTWDPSSGPSMWANPFMVGKRSTLRVEFEGESE
jgi:hypothetical protein